MQRENALMSLQMEKRNNVCGDGEPDAAWRRRDTNPFSVCPTVTSAAAALVSDTLLLLLLVRGSKSCQMLLISESLIESQHAGKTCIV